MSDFLKNHLKRMNEGTPAEGEAATPVVEPEVTIDENEPFGSPELPPEEGAAASVVEDDADTIVVVEPEDEAHDPDADLVEAAEVGELNDLVTSGETYGWSAGLLDFAAREGYLAGTALETMGLEGFANYSMEADGAAVGGEISKHAEERTRSLVARILGRIHGLWEHVSGKFKKASAEISEEAKSTAPLSDKPRKVIPYKTVLGVAASVLAAAGVIAFASRQINFKALSAPGAIAKMRKAVMDAMKKIGGVFSKTVNKHAAQYGGDITPRRLALGREALGDHGDSVEAVVHGSVVMSTPEEAGWSRAGIKELSAKVNEAEKTTGQAMSGVEKAAKSPDTFLQQMGKVAKAGAVVGASVGAVGSAVMSAVHGGSVGGAIAGAAFNAVMGAINWSISFVFYWLIYKVVMKGINIIRGGVKKATA